MYFRITLLARSIRGLFLWYSLRRPDRTSKWKTKSVRCPETASSKFLTFNWPHWADISNVPGSTPSSSIFCSVLLGVSVISDPDECNTHWEDVSHRLWSKWRTHEELLSLYCASVNLKRELCQVLSLCQKDQVHSCCARGSVPKPFMCHTLKPKVRLILETNQSNWQLSRQTGEMKKVTPYHVGTMCHSWRTSLQSQQKPRVWKEGAWVHAQALPRWKESKQGHIVNILQ